MFIIGAEGSRLYDGAVGDVLNVSEGDGLIAGADGSG